MNIFSSKSEGYNDEIGHPSGTPVKTQYQLVYSALRWEGNSSAFWFKGHDNKAKSKTAKPSQDNYRHWPSGTRRAKAVGPAQLNVKNVKYRRGRRVDKKPSDNQKETGKGKT